MKTKLRWVKSLIYSDVSKLLFNICITFILRIDFISYLCTIK